MAPFGCKDPVFIMQTFAYLFEQLFVLAEPWADWERSHYATNALYMLVWTNGAATRLVSIGDDRNKVIRIANKLIHEGDAKVNESFSLP